MIYAMFGVGKICVIQVIRTAQRRCFVYVLALVGLLLFVLLTIRAIDFRTHEQLLEEKIASLQTYLEFIDSQYKQRQEELILLKEQIHYKSRDMELLNMERKVLTTLSPEVNDLLKNLTGTKTAAGMYPENIMHMKTPFVMQLMPHLLDNEDSLSVAYKMGNRRRYADVVIGVPTVKREKDLYLLETLKHLVNGLTAENYNSTLIVVFIGESDLSYVLNVSRQIETSFSKEIDDGLIEVISPSGNYYPDFSRLTPTLGDSVKRHKWRTKQNLDTIFLMAYAQSRGVFYLMLEDDVIADSQYMEKMLNFIKKVNISNPKWVIIQFCSIGGIGKLFRSANILHFITYVQIFYTNMPIDWLIEAYLIDLACTLEKYTKECGANRLIIRPKYKTSLFKHIGLYSSLKGKIHSVKSSSNIGAKLFFNSSRANPPLSHIRTNIKVYSGHSLEKAYAGTDFFWGTSPSAGSTIEFWFESPTTLDSYLIRSGNVEHVADIFIDAIVEVLPQNTNNNSDNKTYITVGAFDEFGLSEGNVNKTIGPLAALQIRVLKASYKWVIISEIWHTVHSDCNNITNLIQDT